MLELIDGLPGNVVGIAVSGRLTMQDCQDVLVPALQKSLKRHDKIRLYYELNSRFPGAAWDELDLGLEHASRCERVAIVTDRLGKADREGAPFSDTQRNTSLPDRSGG